MEKRCTKCDETKDVAFFSHDKYSKDGYAGWCKQCWSNRLKNKDSKIMKREPIKPEDLQYIVDNWETKTIEQLSQKLVRKPHHIVNMVYTLRKLGVNLPRKVGGSGNRKVYLDFVKKYLDKNPEKRV